MENLGPTDFPNFSQPPFLRNPLLPLQPIDPSIFIDPSEGPDFDAMRVKRGDVITAASVNEMVGVMETLHNRVQGLEKATQQSLMNRSGRVTEVEGIGRSRAKLLAKQGIVTLYDLGTEPPESVAGFIEDMNTDEAERIVSDAYKLAGGRTGHPLTDIQTISSQKANRLKEAGIKNLKELSTADPQTIVQALGVSRDIATSVKQKAQELIPAQ
jgi:predicted flap endonuclease-1-like 5' DNA nuclease